MWIDSSACIHRVLWLGFKNGSNKARTASDIMQRAFQLYPCDFGFCAILDSLRGKMCCHLHKFLPTLVLL